MEVILAKLLIGHFAFQHVVADHQNRMPDCHRCFLGTMPTLEAGVLSREVGPFGTRSCVCRTDEGASEPLRAFAGLARATFASRLFVAGTHPCPRRKMLVEIGRASCRERV